MEEPYLSVNNISYGYRSTEMVLESVNFYVKKGEFVIITGPNGGGKSTLGRLILQDFKPVCGEIKINGTIGYSVQKLTPPASLPITVSEFLKLDKNPIIPDVYRDFQVDRIANCALNSLSGGQLQKVNLCMAMRENCDFIILDEPDQNLDFTSQDILYKLLQNLQNRHTFIIISHDIHRLARVANNARIVCINKTLHCGGNFSVVHDKHCGVLC